MHSMEWGYSAKRKMRYFQNTEHGTCNLLYRTVRILLTNIRCLSKSLILTYCIGSDENKIISEINVTASMLFLKYRITIIIKVMLLIFIFTIGTYSKTDLIIWVLFCKVSANF